MENTMPSEIGHHVSACLKPFICTVMLAFPCLMCKALVLHTVLQFKNKEKKENIKRKKVFIPEGFI